MTRVNVGEAKTHLSALLERVERGEEIVLCRSGEPVARLVPLAAPRPRQPGIFQGRVDDAFFDPLPDDELDAWSR